MATKFKATVGIIQPDGNTAYLWTMASESSGAPSMTHKELLVRMIGENKLKVSGSYVVASLNAAGVPYASVFTVTRNNESHWHIALGLPQPVRVNRWPPKS